MFCRNSGTGAEADSGDALRLRLLLEPLSIGGEL